MVKSEMNNSLTMLCGLSNKLTVLLNLLSEPKKLLMVMLPSTELNPTTLFAPTLSVKPKLISKLTLEKPLMLKVLSML
jgi:hypothetical protein